MADLPLSHFLATQEIEPGVYESLEPLRTISFGGTVLGLGIVAAVKTVQPEHRLFSTQGSFLRLADPELKLRCTIGKVRDTRTYATRDIFVYQIEKSGKTRACLKCLADFCIPDGKGLGDFSKRPAMVYPLPDSVPDWEASIKREAAEGIIDEDQLGTWTFFYSNPAKYMNIRMVPEGIAAQNTSGVRKDVKSTQEHLPLSERRSVDWCRFQHKLETYADQLGALMFLIDCGPSHVRLVHDHAFIDDVVGATSLEFSIRIFGEDANKKGNTAGTSTTLDLNRWHLREYGCVAGRASRTLNECEIFDEAGRLVVSTSQVSLLRPRI